MAADLSRTITLATTAEHRRLQIAFVRERDRYSHSLFAINGQQTVCLMKSVEGDDQTLWPSSPAWQQLSVEERPGGQVALLVGMAGKSHWSASIECAESRLIFDVACLVRQPPESLGSRYELRQPIEGWDALEAVFAGGMRVRLSDQSTPGCTLCSKSETLSVIGPAPLDATLPQTVRWKYSVDWPG